jgi:hypothetical protein
MNWQRFFPLWIFPILFVLVLTTIWLRLGIVRNSYEVHQKSRILQNLKQEVENKEMELARLKSPRRLEFLTAKFGLSPVKSEQLIRLQVKAKNP